MVTRSSTKGRSLGDATASFDSGSHLISLVTPPDNLVVSIFVQVGSNDYIFWDWALYILAWPTNLVLLPHLADIVAYIELKQTSNSLANFMITFV
jgi:hypothetical protein